MNKKEKWAFYILFLAIIFGVIMQISIFPYREVVECTNNECSMNREYLFGTNYNFQFSRSDILGVSTIVSTAQRTRSRLDNISYTHDGLTLSLFENYFAYGFANDILKTIKSESKNIKITKYWIGYKIEK